MDKIAFFYDLGYQMAKEAAFWGKKKKKKERRLSSAALKGFTGGAALGGISLPTLFKMTTGKFYPGAALLGALGGGLLSIPPAALGEAIWGTKTE